MLRFLLALALVAHLPAGAQKVTDVEIDKFTGKKRVETNYAVLKMGLSDVFRAKLRSVDSTAFITFNGTWAVGVVGTDDPITFLFEDKSTMEIFPTSIQSYDISATKYGTNKHYTHQYRISLGDVDKLSQMPVVSVRRVAGQRYSDLDLKGKNAKNLQELATNFLKELRSETVKGK